ncbi:MAG: hypothetical protein JW712_07905 [Dehalococcoidales bacterium]|nr:hypothetical protein [Dehalococcoidales bacterium]
MIELPLELPVWGWVLVGLGVIAAGIVVAYIIIFFFWKIAKASFSPPIVMAATKPEVKEEEIKKEEPVTDETERNDIEAVDENIYEEETPEIIEEPPAEEISPVIEQPPVIEEPSIVHPSTGTGKKMIRFTMNLGSGFGYPFDEVSSIICWNTSLRNGDAVRDPNGNIMKLRITEPENKEGQQSAILTDELEGKQVPVVIGRKYLKEKTSLDLDKI